MQIEQHADCLMQEIGIKFRDDLVALGIWRKAVADGERLPIWHG